MYHAACKVEFQPFNRSYSQLTFLQLAELSLNHSIGCTHSWLLRNWDTLRWPTDDSLQGLLIESLRDELEHHIRCRRYIFPVEGRSMAQLKLTVTDEREDAQMWLRRVSRRRRALPAPSMSKEPLRSKTLFDRRLDASHASETCRQLRDCQKTLE